MSKNKRKNFVERKGLEKIYYPTGYHNSLNISQDERNGNCVYVYKDKIEIYYHFTTGDTIPTTGLFIRYPNIDELPNASNAILIWGSVSPYVAQLHLYNYTNTYSCLMTTDPALVQPNCTYNGIYSIPRL